MGIIRGRVRPLSEAVHYAITWLEMTSPPAHPVAPTPEPVTLVECANPPSWYFLALYDAVGEDYGWTDQHDAGLTSVETMLARPGLTMHTMIRQGWPQGFFILNPVDTACDIAYLGLVPQAIGRGLGTWLLNVAVATGWTREATKRMTVNTCTLDHPRALALYLDAGFSKVRTEQRTRRGKH